MSHLNEEFRKHFSFSKEEIYLDTPSCGLVADKVLEWRRAHDLNLSGSVSAFRAEAQQFLNACKKTIANYCDCDLQEIALVPNFSLGFNMVLDSLPSGQSILMLENEYPSIAWPIHRRDFDVRLLQVHETLEDKILESVRKHRPDIFVFSMVQWISGIKIDLDFINALKEEFPKMLLIADGTQFLGTEAFHFSQSKIDVLISSNYKWLNAGFGSGLLLIRKQAQHHIFPQVIGFMSAETFDSKEEDTLYMKHFEPGHLDTLVFGSFKQSLELLDSMGRDKVYAHIKDLNSKAYLAFKERNLLLPEVKNRENHATIFNLQRGKETFESLKKSGIHCSLRGSGIRVGFHYYNTESDLHRLLSILD